MSKSDNTEDELSPDEIAEFKDYDLDDQVEILIHIIDGKSFKNLIDAVKQMGKTGIFTFKPESFDYSCYNSEFNSLVEFTIIKSMLNKINECEYRFVSNLEEYTIELPIDLLKNALSQINIKDGITIFKPKTDNIIYIKKYSKIEEKDTAFSALHIPKMRDINITKSPEYSLKESNPTISTTLDSFKFKIDPIIKSKHSSVLLSATHEKICITGSTVEGALLSTVSITDLSPKISISGLSSLGIRPTFVPTIEKEATLVQPILKLFKKMSNFSGDNKINFYIEAGNPIKIMSTIKNFGFIKVYIICEKE